jgi:hypothetical protein
MGDDVARGQGGRQTTLLDKAERGAHTIANAAEE